MNKDENDLTNAVIEIDEVEYLITEDSANKINKRAETIPLKRIIDQAERQFPIATALKAIQDKRIIDRLN